MMGAMDISKIVGGDYRVSRTSSGVRIEVLDYHPKPLTLTREELREFGLVLLEEDDGRTQS